MTIETETPQKPRTIIRDNQGGVRLYATQRGRRIACTRLRHSGHTHLVCFYDSDRDMPYGLSFGKRRVN